MWTPIEAQAQAIDATREADQGAWPDAWLTASDQRVWRV